MLRLSALLESVVLLLPAAFHLLHLLVLNFQELGEFFEAEGQLEVLVLLLAEVGHQLFGQL